MKQDLDLSADDDDVHSWLDALNEREGTLTIKIKIDFVIQQHPLSELEGGFV